MWWRCSQYLISPDEKRAWISLRLYSVTTYTQEERKMKQQIEKKKKRKKEREIKRFELDQNGIGGSKMMHQIQHSY